jgi:hypothetical protein
MNRYMVQSFTDMLQILRENDFEVVKGVETEEVAKFVNLIALSETLIERSKSHNEYNQSSLFSCLLFVRCGDLGD